MAVLAVLAVFGRGSTCHANFSVKIYEDGNSGRAFTQSGAAGTPINITGTDATFFPDFNFINFTATSNSNVATTQANITGTGTIQSVVGGHTLTIVVSDDNFTMPPGGLYSLGSSSSYTAVNLGDAGAFAFQSFAAPGGSVFGMNTPSPGHTYAPLGTSDSFNEVTTPFSYGPPLTLTQSYTWTVPTGGDGSLFQPTGSTIADAQTVPEPSSLVAVSLGGLIAVGTRWRRCRVAG